MTLPIKKPTWMDSKYTIKFFPEFTVAMQNIGHVYVSAETLENCTVILEAMRYSTTDGHWKDLPITDEVEAALLWHLRGE